MVVPISVYLGGSNVSLLDTLALTFGYFDNINSTSRYIFQFMGGVISWRSRLQECFMCTTEVE